MKKVIITGPIFSRSGYGEHTRCVFRALAKNPEKYDLYLSPTKWGQTSWSYKNNSDINEQKLMEHCVQKRQMFQGEYDVSMQVLIPNEWQNLAKVNIGVTAGIETNKSSAQWIQFCNAMDKVVVISKHSKDSFVNTVYDIMDDAGLPQGKLKCTVPMDIIGYPVKEKLISSEETLDIDITTDFNFLSIAQAGPRKALHETVVWFAEQYKDDPNVGLILKANQVNNSYVDRKYMIQSLEQMLAPIKDRKCKIYLLHGNLSEEEIHSLYKNEKIHCYITTTRGEGYGLPIFEAAYSGMPVVAPAWSGHLDFLYMPVQNSKSKKIKNTPMFLKTKYKLQEVSEESVWENVIDADSKWAYSDEKSFKKNLSQAKTSYKMHKENATKLQEYLRGEFTEENIYTKYQDAVSSVAPDDMIEIDNWLQEINNNIETYD